MCDLVDVKLFQGKITHIIDPFNFWAQIGTEADFNNFRNLEEKLNQICDTVGIVDVGGDLDELQHGCYVLVRQKTIWYRAEVSRIDRERRRLDIVYLDYGDTALVSISQVCAACPYVFSYLKPQAVKCRIAGITPLAKNWTTRGINCFKERTRDKIFQTAIVFEDPQFMYHEVSLYNSDEEGRSLAHILMEDEVGLPTDAEVPEYAREVTSALPEHFLENLQFDTDDLITSSDYTCSPVGFDESDSSDLSHLVNVRSYNNSSHYDAKRYYDGNPYNVAPLSNMKSAGVLSDTDSSTTEPNSCLASQHRENGIAADFMYPSSTNNYSMMTNSINTIGVNQSEPSNPNSYAQKPIGYERKINMDDNTFNSVVGPSPVSSNSAHNLHKAIYTDAWSAAVSPTDDVMSSWSTHQNAYQNMSTNIQKQNLDSWNSFSNDENNKTIDFNYDAAQLTKEKPTLKIVSTPSPVKEVVNSTPSPDIPGFNLSSIMTSGKICPADLQELRDVERRVNTKTAVVDNMEKIYEELECEDDNVSTNWGMSDLDLTTPETSKQDVYDTIKSQIESISPMYQPRYNLPAAHQTDAPHQTDTPKHPPHPTQYPQHPTKYKRFHNKGDQPLPYTARPQMVQAYLKEEKSQPVLKLENSEEAEYKFSKTIQKMLQNLDEEDPAIICDQIHQMVPPDGSCEASVLSVCLETLLEKAVMDKINCDKLLTILDSYSYCDIFGPCMEHVIKKLVKIYVRLPVRKTYHTDFSTILTQILSLSKNWPIGVCQLIQNAIFLIVERWIIFNKKGVQVGQDIVYQSELYITCLELVWKTVSDILRLDYPDKYRYFLCELEDKLLADGLTSDLRRRIFNIYKSDLVFKNAASSDCQNDSYVTSPCLKSEASSQTTDPELISRFVQTEADEDDIQVPEDWWLRDSDAINGDNDEEEEEENKENSFSHQDTQDADSKPLVRVSSFSDIYRLENLNKQRSESPLTFPDSNNYSENNQVKVTKRNSERPTEQHASPNQMEETLPVESSEYYLDDFIPNSEKNYSEPLNEESSKRTTASEDSKATTTTNSRFDDLFSPVFAKQKKKSEQKKLKKSSKYGTWADCVKKDNSDSENRQSDHLKHLAIQTLKTGVLKGKNIQARRQLSSEELKGYTKPPYETDKHDLSDAVFEAAKLPTERFNTSPLGKSKISNNIGKLPKHIGTASPETKKHVPKPSKLKYIKGRDLPESAKLTRQMLEEKTELEVMNMFPPNPRPHNMQTRNKIFKTTNQLKTNDPSEWPSLKSEESTKNVKKVVHSENSSNSLMSIAADILLMDNNKPSVENNSDTDSYRNQYRSDSVKGSNSVPRGDTSSDTYVESKSGSDYYVESKGGTSGYDNTDWESDYSDDDFVLTGPASDLAKPASPPPPSMVLPKKTLQTFQSATKDHGWAPKSRTCTNCGESSHIVYDCPQKSSILF